MYEEFKNRMEKHGAYMGQYMRNRSNHVVDSVWMNSVATRPVCVKHIDKGLPPTYNYVEDFDDVVWAHFEVASKYNISKDDVAYYLVFRPGELIRHPEIKIGSYVCIPNIDDIPEWWLIVYIDEDTELHKAYILKTNWLFKWVTDGKIYQCLGCQRYASSYNSGKFDMDKTTKAENMDGLWLPTNQDSDKLGYNQRIMISAGNREIPICWEISKVETTIPVGITKFTVAQTPFDPEHDDVALGLCDYYKSQIEPVPVYEPVGDVEILYNGTKPTLKVGGSYKVFTPKFGELGVSVDEWRVTLEDGSAVGDDYIIERDGDKLKIKVAQNYNLIGTILNIEVSGSDRSFGKLKVEVI